MAEIPTPRDLRAMIYCRIGVATESCNTHHRGVVRGQIQGLLFALTGETHHFGDDVGEIMDLAGIPYTRREDGILETPDEWMKKHGFSPDGNGGYGNHHPRFSGNW